MSRPPVKFTVLLACAGVLSGCAAAQPVKAPSPPLPTEKSPKLGEDRGQIVAAVDVEQPAIDKAYYVGNLIDPNNPDQMQGAHVVYRRERDARFNRNARGVPALAGPLSDLRQSGFQPMRTSPEVESFVAKQSQLLGALSEQNEVLLAKVRDFETQLKSPPAPPPPPGGSAASAPREPFAAKPARGPSAPEGDKRNSAAVVSAPSDEPQTVILVPSADNIIELSPQLLEPPIPGETNPFSQRYHPKVTLREVQVKVTTLGTGPVPSAVVNGQVLGAGDQFENLRVDRITSDHLYLRRENFVLEIPLQDAPITLRLP